MNERFKAAPIATREYVIDGKKYIVTAHYVGDKDIDNVLNNLAIEKAYAEIAERNIKNNVRPLDKCV